MAVKSAATSASAASRRWFFGTNVAVMVILAAFLLIAVNWVGHKENRRRDLSGGLAGHRISERTKRILDKAGDNLRITTVYASDNPDTARKEFFPKVQDLCEEIRQYKKSVNVQHLIGGNDQAQLRDRIQQKFGTAAKAYEEVVTLAGQVWSELADTLAPRRQAVAEMLGGNTWLSGFSTLANIAAVLQKDLKNIEDTRQEVDGLVRGEGIPRYQEANTKIKTANDELKRHLDQAQSWMKEMDKLTKLLSDPNSGFATTTRTKLTELSDQLANLKKIAGDPADTSVPGDPRPILQDFAKAAMSLSDWLTAESGRINTFVSEYPAIQQHPKWQIQQAIFVVELPGILAQTAEDLGNNGRQLRNILQEQNAALDQLQNVVRQLRQIGVQVQQSLNRWVSNVTDILKEGAEIDAKSKEFLAKGGAGEMFKPALDRLNEVGTKIAALPELKLDEIATRMQQDNIVVVERGDEVRVVSFDEAWAIADPTGGMRRGNEEGGAPRVFDGDSAISSAILAMESTKSLAKVVLVTFEEEVAPQMRQFQRPMTGPMPLEAVGVLRQKLERMQFKVETWNLAEQDAKNKVPTSEEGVPLVYVFLPPPPAPPPFMRQQQQQKTFTAEDAEVARKVLANNGRGLFLGLWMQPFRFGPPPEFGWAPVLRDDWGITVDVSRRVIRGIVDRKQPGRYAIDVVQWWYMQLSNFTEQPIGYPLRARRMLMKDTCPVSKMDKVPDKVKISPVLEVPRGLTDIWAEEDIERIFQALQTGSKESSFTKSAQVWDPPFTVVLAAEKEAEQSATTKESDKGGEKGVTGSKIVVMGNALSLRDDYLEQRVVRFGGKGTRLMTDPPPTENLDLCVNALYWLADRPELIAAGPAEVPVVGPIEASSRHNLWLVSVGWAFAALVVGGVMMMIRRK